MLITELGEQLNKLLVNNITFTDNQIRDLINSYDGDDWKNYIIKNETTYNKIKVFETDIFDIYIISWNIGQKSKVHNHPEIGCWLKVLQGSIQEKIYNSKFELIKYNTQKIGDISFMKDEIGYHSVHNVENHLSVSLHVYNPPNFKITSFF